MRTKLKQKWIDALRSGKYKQGRSQLHSSIQDSYCVLGVLLDVIDNKAWFMDAWQDAKTQWTFSRLIPDSFGKRIGLSEENAEVLMRMNDDGGWSFNELARVIESAPSRALGYHKKVIP